MFAFIIYELKVAVILAAFYLCFKCFLSKEKLHRFNRIVLITSSVLAFILPLCIITIHKTIPMPDMVENGLISIEEAQTFVTATEAAGSISWKAAIITLYLLGVAYVLVGIVTGIARVMKVIRNGKRMQMYGCEVVICEKDVPPFSWMHWIVMSRTDFESGNRHILEHEKAHVRLGHSKDVLLVDILSAFQWFNPAIWLLKGDLRAVHEYEADDAVLSQGVNIKEYQYSLIRKAVTNSGYSIANNFNHSMLKSRINMMSRSKAPAAKGLKAIYLLPLLGCALALNAKTVFDYDSDAASVGTVMEAGEINEVNVIAYGELKERMVPLTTDEVSVDFSKLDKVPDFEGGDANAFSLWVNRRLRYPESAKAAGVTGRVVVSFKVNSDGRVSDVNVLRGICDALDEEAVRVVSSSPDWTPGEVDGKPVATIFTFPVIFALRNVERQPR